MAPYVPETKVYGTPEASAAAASPGTIPEGVWTVGTDIDPGTYRTAVAVQAADACYWEITKSGTNGGTIIKNGFASGGRPTVVLKVGEDFTSNRCGTWVKQ